MRGVVFWHTLRRSWRGALWWGIGFALYGLYATVILSNSEILTQYSEIMKTFPKGLLQAFGIPNDIEFMATPNGFISFSYFGYALLLQAIYAVLSGLNITANDEDQGILDVVLSLPVPRWRVIAEKFAAYALLLVGINVLGLAGLAAGLTQSPLEYDFGRVVESVVNLLPYVLLLLALTLCLAGFIRTRSTVASAAAGFIVVSYFLNVIANAAQGTIAEPINRLSLFFYYDNNGVMQNGIAPITFIAASGLVALLVVGGMWAFQRRDVGI